MSWAKIRKALVAAGAGAIAAGGTALEDGVITSGEWWTILGAALVAGWAVWRVPNAPQ